MVPRRSPGPAGRRLTKAEAAALLRDYDSDPSRALGSALGAVLGLTDHTWAEMLAAAPISDTRRAALLSGDERALDDLAAELNELRTLHR